MDQTNLPHRLNWQDSSLEAVVARLAESYDTDEPGQNAILRIGGSPADRLGFGADTDQSIKMDENYWDGVAAFARKSHVSVSFCLNDGPSMRMSSQGANVWNSTNARKFLSYVEARPEQRSLLAAVQLGNEPGHALTGCDPSVPLNCPTAQEHGRDFQLLRAVLQDVFGAQAPRIQGPDACLGLGNGPNPNITHEEKCANLTYFEDLLRAADGAIDDITVHKYGFKGHVYAENQCHLADFLSPAAFEPHMRRVLRDWYNTAARAAPGARMVLSETASSPEAGCPGLSNTYASGFWFVNQLGLTAGEGFWQLYRQNVIGSDYSLAGDNEWVGGPPDEVWMNRTAPLKPNPDFFTALLWQRLMGRTFLSSSLGEIKADSAVPVRVHVACAGMGALGDVAIAFVNGGNEQVSARLNALRPRSRVEYVLTPADEHGMLSRSVRLNGGDPLQVDDQLVGRRVHGLVTHLVLPAQTYGFFVLEQVGATACAEHLV